MSYLAQTFRIEVPTNISGTFITNALVYFRRKAPDLEVTAAITEMKGGEPDPGKVLAYSLISNDRIITSEDASESTVFPFNHPVFLSNNKTYALVLKTEGNSPEFEYWTAVAGSTDINNDKLVYETPTSGTLMESLNGYIWKPHLGENLKYDLFRARFTALEGKAVFAHEDDDYFFIDNITRSNSEMGIEVGDIALSVNASSNTVMTGDNTPYGIVQRIDEGNGEVVLDFSTGLYEANTTLQFHRIPNYIDTTTVSSNTLIASATLETIRNIPVHSIVPKFPTFAPSETDIQYKYLASLDTGSGFSVETSAVEVLNNDEHEYLDESRFILSRSNEVTELSGDTSSKYEVHLRTDNNFVAPVIDLSRGKTSLVIENLVNDDATDEDTRYGNALSRYISKTVVLKDGQESEDLKVYLTAYRPVGTDIKVYGKFLNGTDPEPFDEKVWTELDYTDGSDFTFSNPLDTEDYLEYEFDVPAEAPVTNGAFINPSTSLLNYSNSEGTDFVGYKKFAIKVVLLSNNPVRVPRLADIRAIALLV